VTQFRENWRRVPAKLDDGDDTSVSEKGNHGHDGPPATHNVFYYPANNHDDHDDDQDSKLGQVQVNTTIQENDELEQRAQSLELTEMTIGGNNNNIDNNNQSSTSSRQTLLQEHEAYHRDYYYNNSIEQESAPGRQQQQQQPQQHQQQREQSYDDAMSIPQFPAVPTTSTPRREDGSFSLIGRFEAR